MTDPLLRPVAGGPLAESYPIGAHDVELVLPQHGAAAAKLRAAAMSALATDPRCRRVVIAVPVVDLPSITCAENAGFRYTIDVDIAGEDLSLLVFDRD